MSLSYDFQISILCGLGGAVIGTGAAIGGIACTVGSPIKGIYDAAIGKNTSVYSDMKESIDVTRFGISIAIKGAGNLALLGIPGVIFWRIENAKMEEAMLKQTKNFGKQRS